MPKQDKVTEGLYFFADVVYDRTGVAPRERSTLACRAEEVPAICDSCLSSRICLPKEDPRPCRDFVPSCFWASYVYINGKWLKIVKQLTRKVRQNEKDRCVPSQ